MSHDVPLFQKIYDLYRLYYQVLDHFPKKSRGVLGARIETRLLDLLETITALVFLSGPEKVEQLVLASNRVDRLKILIRLSYELRLIDQKKYLLLQEKLDEIGRMIGGWLKTTTRSTKESG